VSTCILLIDLFSFPSVPVTHIGMFVPTLINFGTKEQQAEWVQRAYDCKVIGTYAQTELGHGTFIRGLETTAIYDTKRREFVIHSPSINAYKVLTSSDPLDPTEFLFVLGLARWTRAHCQPRCCFRSALHSGKALRRPAIHRTTERHGYTQADEGHHDW
jgi:Acyl-coenzyme A oxidase N-terminal